VIADYEAEAREIAPTVTLLPYDDGDGPVPGLDEAEGILRSWGVARWKQLVADGPRIRWVHTPSAGVDGVLVPAVRNKPGLVLTDSGPAFTDSIPEFVLAWILMVARRLPQFIEQQRRHVWQGIQQDELTGRTIGIIGLGPIGLGVARRAKAFGTCTIGLRRHGRPAENVDEVVTGPEGLNRLVRESDYIVIAAALTEETRHIIGAPEIAKMKPSAWIVNIARGAHIDQAALIDALQNDVIAGACLDVFDPEPLPADSPLWDMPNVYIAPHNSTGNAPSVRRRQREIFLENLRRFAAGEPLENVVDFERGY
jgi:phosphoglycerate dehydrogenase-like enzyme